MSEKPNQFGAGKSDEDEIVVEKSSVPLPENFPEISKKINKSLENIPVLPNDIKISENGIDTSEVIEPLSSTTTNNYPENSLMTPSKDETSGDGLKEIFSAVKTLDANRYATKKTIAQGMLDIALLTANASQLKYILQVGKQHEFYTLMLTLICLSIGLQILQGIICLLLGGGYNINKEKDQKNANTWNNIVLAMMIITVAVNILISAFEIREDNHLEQLPRHSGYYPY